MDDITDRRRLAVRASIGPGVDGREWSSKALVSSASIVASIGPGVDGREWCNVVHDSIWFLAELQLGPALMAGNGNRGQTRKGKEMKLQLGPALMAGNGGRQIQPSLPIWSLQLGPALMAGNGFSARVRIFT